MSKTFACRTPASSALVGEKSAAVVGQEKETTLKRRWMFLKEKAATLPDSAARWDVLLWAIFTCILASVHILLCVLGKADSHGFATLRTGKKFKNLQVFNTMAIQLPLNVLSGIMVFASDYVRRCLLAPPKDDHHNPEGKIAYQSLEAWSEATKPRKTLWLVLMVTSLPIHLLYNSLIFASMPAFDAYEILVDHRFFSGVQFEVAALGMTQFWEEPGAPMPYNTPWPSQWPGAGRLQQVLEEVQRNPSLWTNLSNPACRGRYGLDVYSQYRTVILVTNWTQNLLPDNSALALGALPGFPPVDVPNRFLALCPEAYLSWVGWPGLNALNSGVIPYVETSDLPQCRRVNSGFCDNVWGSNDVYPVFSQDLCYAYGPISDVAYNASHQGPTISYCLSEPITDTTARLVWSKYITEIITVALSIKAVAMVLAWTCVCYDQGFPNGFPWEAVEVNGEGGATGFALYVLINVALAGFTSYLALGIGMPFRDGAIPASPTDRRYVLGILIFQNILHPLMVVREYLECNRFQSREGTTTGKRKTRVPLPVAMFLWNLGLHQLVSAWLGAGMLDHHPIGSIENAIFFFFIMLIRESTLSGHVGVTSLLKSDSPVMATFVYFLVPFICILVTSLQICWISKLEDWFGTVEKKADEEVDRSSSQSRAFDVESASLPDLNSSTVIRPTMNRASTL